MNRILTKCFLSLMLAGVDMTFLSCSSNDDETSVGTKEETAIVKTVLTPDGGKYVLYKPDFLGSISDTGTVRYSEREKAWYVDSDTGYEEGRIDGGIYYMTYEMPEQYQHEGLRVDVKGDIYKYHHREDADGKIVVLAGWDYYYLDVKEIYDLVIFF